MSSEPHDSSEEAGLPEDVTFALDTLARVVERHSTEFRASVLLLSNDGTRLLDCAGPRLPTEFRDAIHGAPIGEGTGSCGTAAYRNERVIVTDIAHDPLWSQYRDLALPHGLRACWSEPIRSDEGAVLGTFALYYDEPREPTENDLKIIEAAAARAGIMIEHARAGMPREELVSDLG